MQMIDLSGAWRVGKTGEEPSLDGVVPGCIHTDLLAAGKIPDPYYRMNELDVQWVSEADWTYTRTFEVAAELLEEDMVLLECDGLDTLATVRVNGRKVGEVDNQFRKWTFDVRRVLKPGANTIEVAFRSPHKLLQRLNKKRPMRGPVSKPWEWHSRGYIRKSPCNFGWDWGVALPTCGIWRAIRITAFSVARLDDVQVRQQHGRNKVTLDVAVDAERTSGRERLTALVSVTYRGRAVAEVEKTFNGRATRVSLDVRDPKLWWPNNMGGQPLYEVTVDLVDADGEVLDTCTRRIGLRTLTLRREKDKWGQSFAFEVNGVPFFAKGANWIPADQFPTRIEPERYRDLVTSAAGANMNMLRVWGGGIYEDQLFYDLCDEMGICVWQDFMFACSVYPGFDDDFVENVRAEAEYNVRRINHHPCIALWCGNNELEDCNLVGGSNELNMTVKEYCNLFDKVLGGIVKRDGADIPYWPSSGHTPVGKRWGNSGDPKAGDAHLWAVWHGGQPFEWYRTCEHRFNSEFGFQSFPEPATVATFAEPADRNVTTPVMEHHQRCGTGNAKIMRYMLDWFRLPMRFDRLVWLSQILQGMAMKYACEHWRRSMPRGMGTLYWQFNDNWPVASWASVDYFGRWKALNHMARHFYAPILVSGLEDMAKGIVDVYVTNDTNRPLKGRVKWTLTTARGEPVVEDSFPVEAGVRKSTKTRRIDVSEVMGKLGNEDTLVWLELESGGETVSRNLVLFARPKHLDLQDPKIKVSVRKEGDAFVATLTSRAAALWAWLETSDAEVRYSDNFVHLRPDQPTEITITPREPVSLAALRKDLAVSSLYDTYAG